MIPPPPEERFDQHVDRTEVPPDVLEDTFRRHRPDLFRPRFRKLSGGFQNANYLAETEDESFVLRFYSTGAATGRLEAGLLRFLEKQGVRAPRVLNLLEGERLVVVLEFLDGDILQSALKGNVPPELFRQVGRELAKVHSIEFPRAGFVELPQAGFIGQHIKIGEQYDSFALFLREFIYKTMREVSREKLDPNVRDRLVKLVEDKWDLVLATEPVRQLVHSDFNPKNVMVSGRRVTGIIDWEFGLSGNGLIDLGNFFRFAGDYPPGSDDAFIEGYRETRPTPENWRDVARLLDLGNMCSFLERRENYQKTFATARAVIAGTLSHFGY